jgi:hypothetical protein
MYSYISENNFGSSNQILFPPVILLSIKFLFVTGLFLSLITANMFVHPISGSVMFLKKRDAILTNDVWCIAVEEVIFIIKTALLTVEQKNLLLYPK